MADSCNASSDSVVDLLLSLSMFSQYYKLFFQITAVLQPASVYLWYDVHIQTDTGHVQHIYVGLASDKMVLQQSGCY